MSDKISQLAPKILELVKKSNHILLHCHLSPDPDSVGSVLAMSRVIQGMGKRVSVIAGDSKPPQRMAFLPGFDQITPKNYLEIDPASFDLFLILDSSNANMISKKGEVNFPKTLKTVVIDHHASNMGFGSLNLVEPDYPATAQIVYELLRDWQVDMTPDIARCLMLGLYSDTGGFQYLTVSPEWTLKVASELARSYPDYPKDIFALDNSNEPQLLMFEGLALSSIEVHFDNRVAVSAVSLQALQQKGIRPELTENGNIANRLTSVTSWEIGVSLIEREQNQASVSIRTRDADRFDVSKLALALGGGGHQAAAGALIRLPFEKAKRLVLNKIKDTYSL